MPDRQTEPTEGVEVLISANTDDHLGALLRALAHTDWRVRRAAASSIPEADITAVSEPLYALLASEDAGTRNAAIKAFVRIGSPALAYLLPGLHDADPDVRNFCALALGLIGDHAATADLVAALRDEGDSNVQYMIVEALGRLNDPAAIPCLIEALDRDAWIKAPAVDALGRMRCSQAVTALIDLLGDEMVGGVAAEALARTGDVRGVMPLAAAAASATGIAAEIYLSALATLLTSPTQGGPILLLRLRRLLSEEDAAALRGSVSRALTDKRAAGAALAVAEWLDDATLLPEVMGALDDVALREHGLRVVARLLAAADIREVRLLGEQASVHARQILLEAIAAVGAGGSARWMIDALADENPLVVASAARALGHVGSPADAEAILPLLRHPLDEVRRAAAEAIGRLGAEHVAAALLAMADEGPAAVRCSIATVLAQHDGWSDERLGTAARLMSEDNDRAVRMCAARIIGTAPSDVADALAEYLSLDAEAPVRRAVADALSRSSDPVAREHLQSLVSDTDAGVRVAALNGLIAHATPSDLALFDAAVDDRDPRVRIAALAGLSRLACREASPAIRRALDERDPDVFCAALHALSACDPSEAEAVAVGSLLSSDWRIRTASVELLRAVGGDGARDSIMRGLVDEDRTVRCAAISACPRVMGSDAVSHLLVLLDDDDVSAEAEDALLQIACDSRDSVLSAMEGATGKQRSALLRIAVAVAEDDEAVLLPLLGSDSPEDRFYGVLGLAHGSEDAIWAIKEASLTPQAPGVDMLMSAIVASHARGTSTRRD